MTAPLRQNVPRARVYKFVAVGFLAVSALVLAAVYVQFRGGFTPTTSLTMLSARAGLVMDPGSSVTYNGVQIGRVASIEPTERNGRPAAKFTLDVKPRYVKLLPANVDAEIVATTLFGNKYVSLSSPEHPDTKRFNPKKDVIDATAVTTEVNTLFETITNLSANVDPVKLNLTLHAAAQALTGLGDKLGESVVHGNEILDHFNARMPAFRRDLQQFAALGDIYYAGAPDLIGFADTSVVTLKTLVDQQRDLTAVWAKTAPVGRLATETTNTMGPDLNRMFADLVPTTALLDAYYPELPCTLRNTANIVPRVFEIVGGDGYSLNVTNEAVSPQNVYIYPENLPRINAHGGPGGAPGCWQEITHDFWPAPYLVADTGVSQAPYNHFDIGSPWAIEYIWGRQVGDYTINP